RTTVAPQHMFSFTLDRETLPRGESRLQISAVVTFPSMPDLRDARVSVEVIDNATGTTTVLFGDYHIENIPQRRLTMRCSQPLAVATRGFDFMRELSMVETLAA